jgi:hypothetical protein
MVERCGPTFSATSTFHGDTLRGAQQLTGRESRGCGYNGVKIDVSRLTDTFGQQRRTNVETA